MQIRLNKELIKPGTDLTPEDISSAELDEQESDSAEGLSPLIEVEKYTDSKDAALKSRPEDTINFFVDFKFNSLTAKERTTLANFNFHTSTETDLGLQYIKYYSRDTSFFGVLLANTFGVAEVPTFTPPLEAKTKTLLGGSLGVRYALTENYWINGALNFIPHYFLTVNNIGNLELEHNPLTSLAVEFETQFHANSEFNVGLEVGGEFISNAKYAGAGDALAFNAGAIFQQQYRSHDSLRIKVTYNQETLVSNLFELVNQTVSLSFLYSLPY